MTSLSEIADGAAFDVTEAVRAIARQLTVADGPSDEPCRHAAGELEEVLDARLAQILRSAGLDTPAKVRRASDTALLRLDGIGAKSLARIRAQLEAAQAKAGQGGAARAAVWGRQLTFAALDGDARDQRECEASPSGDDAPDGVEEDGRST